MDLVTRLYDRFNAQDIDGLFKLLVPDIIWANGMEGGHVTGYDEVRMYWTRQWQLFRPRVTPLSWISSEDVIEVRVRQQAFSLSGDKLADSEVYHLFKCVDGKIARFDIAEK